jgi:hypothetical protein
MQDTTATIIIAVLGSNVLVEIIRIIAERTGKETPEKLALRALCEDRLGTLLRRWLHADVRLADDWRIIENLYTGYKALDGNGEIKKLYEEASDLKTTE